MPRRKFIVARLRTWQTSEARRKWSKELEPKLFAERSTERASASCPVELTHALHCGILRSIGCLANANLCKVFSFEGHKTKRRPSVSENPCYLSKIKLGTEKSGPFHSLIRFRGRSAVNFSCPFAPFCG